MTKLRLILLSVLVGQALMLPTILKLKNSPRIEALVVPQAVYDTYTTEVFTINGVPNKWNNDNTVLRIHLVHPDLVREEYGRRYPNSEMSDVVFGFYDILEHDIWAPNDATTLIHELRHVFEGNFHQ
jgi:hypothetical protein